jgi:hypothetical protein
MMSPKINGLMADTLRRVLHGAVRTAIKRPDRHGAPSCESLEGRVVLSNWGGADLLGGLSQIGVVTTVLDVGGPRGGQSRFDGGSAQNSQPNTDLQTLQTKIQSLAAKSGVTVADLSALTSDSQAIATAGGGLKVDNLKTVLSTIATAVAGGGDATQAQADFNALFSGSKVDQTTIDKTFNDLVQTIKDSKITTADLADFASAVAAVPNMGSPMNGPGDAGAPGWFNGAGPQGDLLTASLANAGVAAASSSTAQQATPSGPGDGTQSSQLKTDLDKLRTDMQTVTAKSGVTSSDLDQIKTDAQNIASAGLKIDPKSLQTAINTLVAAVAAGSDTTKAQADFNALFSGSSVSRTVIDQTFNDLVQTIKDSKITSDDATLIADDQAAVQKDFAALPQNGPGIDHGGFTVQRGGFFGQDGPGGRFAVQGGFGGHGGFVRQDVGGGQGGTSAGVNNGGKASSASTAGNTAPTNSSYAAPEAGNADPGGSDVATPSVAVDQGGAARGRIGRVMTARFGRNAEGGNGGGVGGQAFNSSIGRHSRSMNRFRKH